MSRADDQAAVATAQREVVAAEWLADYTRLPTSTTTVRYIPYAVFDRLSHAWAVLRKIQERTQRDYL